MESNRNITSAATFRNDTEMDTRTTTTTNPHQLRQGINTQEPNETTSPPVVENEPPTNNNSEEPQHPQRQDTLPSLDLFFPDLAVSAPLPLRLSPLHHLPQLISLYSTILQSYQSTQTEESRVYQRRQYSEVISEGLVEVLRECLEYDLLNKADLNDLSFLNEKYLKSSRRDGWKKLQGYTEDGEDQSAVASERPLSGVTSTTLGGAESTISTSRNSQFSKLHVTTLQNTNSSKYDGSTTVNTPMTPVGFDDDTASSFAPLQFSEEQQEEALRQEKSAAAEAARRAAEVARRRYHHFISFGQKHLGMIIYGDEKNSEILRERVAKKMELILERFEFSIMEIFKKEAIESSPNMTMEHKLLMETLEKELLAQRNITEGLQARIEEMLSNSQRDKILIDSLNERLKSKDNTISQLREQYMEDVQQLREQIMYGQTQERRPTHYDPADYHVFLMSRVDNNITSLIEKERHQMQLTVQRLQHEFDSDRQKLIKEKFEALDALKKHLFLDTNFSVFDDVVKPVTPTGGSDASEKDYKHLKLVTTENMERVREKYESMRSMMEQMKTELYRLFDEKEHLTTKVTELFEKLRKQHVSQKDAKAESDEIISDHRIQLNKLEMERKELEDRMKELMYENQQSRSQILQDVEQLKFALSKADEESQSYKRDLEALSEEKNSLLQKQKTLLSTKGTGNGSSQGRLVNIKRTSTDAGIQFGSHRHSLSVKRFTKEQQTKAVRVFEVDSDDEDNWGSARDSKYAQTPRTRQKRRLAENKIRMQAQQTSPQLLKSYIKKNASQFASLFPKPKVIRVKSRQQRRPKSRVNFIEKNSKLDTMDDATRQLVENIIALDEHTERTDIEADDFISRVQEESKKLLQQQRRTIADPSHHRGYSDTPTHQIQTDSQFEDEQSLESEGEETNQQATGDSNTIKHKQRPKTSFSQRGPLSQHYTMETEHQYHHPSAKHRLSDYLKVHDDLPRSQSADALDERFSKTEFKPGVSIVEVIDKNENSKKPSRSKKLRKTSPDPPVQENDHSAESSPEAAQGPSPSLNQMLKHREYMNMQKQYEKKIAILKEQKRILQQRLEESEISADTLNQLRGDIRSEMKEKHAAEVSQLTTKLHKANRQITIFESMLKKIDVTSYFELIDAVKQAVNLESQFQQMGVRQDANQETLSSLRSIRAVTIPSTKTGEFSYTPREHASLHHDLEKYQNKLDAQWRKVLNLSRRLSTAKKRSKLAVTDLDPDQLILPSEISDEITRGRFKTTFKPKKSRSVSTKKRPPSPFDSERETPKLIPLEIAERGPASTGDTSGVKTTDIEGQTNLDLPMSSLSPTPPVEEHPPPAKGKTMPKNTHSTSRTHRQGGTVRIPRPNTSYHSTTQQTSIHETPHPQLQSGNASSSDDLTLAIPQNDTLKQEETDEASRISKGWSSAHDSEEEEYNLEEAQKMMKSLSRRRPHSQSAVFRSRRAVSRAQMLRKPKPSDEPPQDFMLGPPSLKPKLKPRQKSKSLSAKQKRTDLRAKSASRGGLPPKRKVHSSLGFRKPLGMNPAVREGYKRTVDGSKQKKATDAVKHPLYTLQHSDLVHLAKAQKNSNVIDKMFIDQQKQHLFGVGKAANYKMDDSTEAKQR